MALGPKTQREQLMLAAPLIAIALLVVYYLYIYSPRTTELAAIETHLEAIDATNQRAKAEMAKGSANELRAQAKQYADNLELMRQLVPTGQEVPALLEQVSTAARRVGLDLGSVEPEPVIPGETFDTYRYRITIVGGYHDVAEFLTNVGSLTRIIAPVNFKLTPVAGESVASKRAETGEATLKSEFEMQTYVAKSAAPERAAPEPRT